MNKNEFFKYLEDDSLQLKDDDNAAFAQLLDEVASLDTPQPDQTYWNNFNSSLQKRIDALPTRRRISFRLLFTPILATAAIVLLFLLLKPESQGLPGLEGLNNEELQLASLVYEDLSFYDEDTTEDSWSLGLDQLSEKDLEILIDSVDHGTGAGPLYSLDPASFNADEFHSLWKSEG